MNDIKLPIWFPSEERIRNSNFQHYFEFLKNHFNKDFNNYQQLYDWSTSEIEEFWKSIWDYSSIIHSKSYTSILDSSNMPDSVWFRGAKINFAENLLKFRDDQIAIISFREKYPVTRLTYKQLYHLVAKCSEGLKRLGVKAGDRVAAYVSNYPETVIAMLAATSIGAIWSSTSPDFGVEGVIDRFAQIEPKILFAIDSYNYAGKRINCRQKIDEISSRLKSVDHIILINEFEDLINLNKDENNKVSNDKFIHFNQLINNISDKIDFFQTDFNYPAYILYSSGTTGKPKCIAHGAGGTLIQHFKELHLHTDLKREDKIAYYTTCGWMMWNWLISSLQLGVSIVLIDGSPVYPNIETLWKFIQDEKINIFGTSPKYLSSIEKSGLIPKDKFDLSKLKTILSTGAPLCEESFNWVYTNVKKDVLLSSISGGTDIISCFVLGCPILPVYSGEIQCSGLGMKVESWDQNGNAVIEEKGELVCTQPFPSAPIYFMNDPEKEKYLNSYFRKYPGVWHHGDFIKITKHGGVIVYGRSDATLNPGGVRIGTAEIYNIVESFDEILDSVVIGQKYLNDVRVILFIVLKEGIIFDQKLIDKLKYKIRESATPRHVPSLIFQVSSIPHTISGKKVEIAVTKILNGENIDNLEAIANPESLEQFNHIYKSLEVCSN